MSLYCPKRWLYVVSFARDTSPKSACCTCNVVAANPEHAIAQAWQAFREAWRDDAKYCAVLGVRREEPIHSEESEGERHG